MAVRWRLAHPLQALSDARPGRLPLRTWRELVIYHDLVEQQYGFDLVGDPIKDQIVPLLSYAQPQFISHPPFFPFLLAGCEMDDGTTLSCLVPSTHKGKVWSDFDPVPIRLAVVDSATGHVLSDVPHGKRDRVALLDPAGYLAFVPRAKRVGSYSTTFFCSERHLSSDQLGHPPRRGHFTQLCTLPFPVKKRMFVPPYIARYVPHVPTWRTELTWGV